MVRMSQSESEKYQNDLQLLRKYLQNKPRDLLLFEFLLQKKCTTTDILMLKVGDLVSCHENTVLSLIGGKAVDGPLITSSIRKTFNRLLVQGENDRTDYLFKSRKGGQQLSVTSVSRLVRTWLRKTELTYYKGVHDLRLKLGPYALGMEVIPEGEKTDLNSLRSIKATSRYQAAYKELLQSIISGNIAPGQRLLPEKIAEKMQVSTTPVREAFSRLEAKGFITRHDKRGWIANELSRTRLKEILDLRILLESEAAYQAAKHITAETLEKLDIAQHKYEQLLAGGSHSEQLEANKEFHMLAYSAADSAMMQKIISELWDLSSPYYQVFSRQSLVPQPTIGVDFHAKFVDALRKRNPDDAKYWLKKDLVQLEHFLFNLIDAYMNSIE